MTLALKNKLQRRKKAGNLRTLQVFEHLIDFASNDYLGLARSKKLANLAIRAWGTHQKKYMRFGSTGSRLLTGNVTYIQDLESYIAFFHRFPAGLLFNCGYMANVGLLSAVADRNSAIFFDSQIHASMHDGIRLSRARALAFRHNDLNHLENRLKNCLLKERFICIESLYSTNGSIAPLEQICQLADRYHAHLIIDEAHAVGVFGSQGRGLVDQMHLQSHVFAQVVTFGKALGTHGAIVLGSNLLKQALLNFATSFIYTTALPLQMFMAIKCSYDLFPQLEQERKKLQELIKIFKKISPISSDTHIQSFQLKGNHLVKRKAQQCKNFGYDVRPLLSPTVQRGKERLRICLHAFNKEKDLASLLTYLLERDE